MIREIIIDCVALAGFGLQCYGLYGLWGLPVACLVAGTELLILGLVWAYRNAD